jgi:2-succinyl-5-enolpyruvyl-6-hydroxy-3-cyclohexene-1-carboxylate synthase/2-succinyl-6-hydroxy-2,4-cyclohexadiene-1-carboxylate synthase
VAGLASSLRLAGTGTQAPLWDRLPALTMPVLLVAGALDAKFVAAAERMAGLLPRPTLAVIEDAGHSVHLERPDRLLAILEPWLAAT